MDLTSQALAWRRVCATNATNASFPTRAPQAAEPVPATSGFEGVLEIFSRTHGPMTFPRSGSPINLMLMFFGTDAANETFKARVYGWRRLSNATGDLWVPVLLAQVTCVMGGRSC